MRESVEDGARLVADIIMAPIAGPKGALSALIVREVAPLLGRIRDQSMTITALSDEVAEYRDAAQFQATGWENSAAVVGNLAAEKRDLEKQLECVVAERDKVHADYDQRMDELGRIIMTCPSGMRADGAVASVQRLRRAHDNHAIDADELRHALTECEKVGVERGQQIDRLTAERDDARSQLSMAQVRGESVLSGSVMIAERDKTIDDLRGQIATLTADAKPTSATGARVVDADAETVKPLDLNTVLRHAFMSGWIASRGIVQNYGRKAPPYAIPDPDSANGAWVEYDPTNLDQYKRVHDALYTPVPNPPTGLMFWRSAKHTLDRFNSNLDTLLAARGRELTVPAYLNYSTLCTLLDAVETHRLVCRSNQPKEIDMTAQEFIAANASKVTFSKQGSDGTWWLAMGDDGEECFVVAYDGEGTGHDCVYAGASRDEAVRIATARSA